MGVGNYGAADSNGRDDDGLRRRAAGKSGHSPRDPSGTSIRRDVHCRSSGTDNLECGVTQFVFAIDVAGILPLVQLHFQPVPLGLPCKIRGRDMSRGSEDLAPMVIVGSIIP
jgi:hypothetical protein